MRIVIDMQGAQSSGSRHRGIGRYTLALAQSIVRNRGGNEVLLVLNGLFSESIAEIRLAFSGLLPSENIRVWQAPGPLCHNNVHNSKRRGVAELLRESFLNSLKPDIILVSSLFEGFIDDAVTSIGALNKNIPTAVILYDLIPLIHRRPYLDDSAVKSWYESKLDHLSRSDLLLSISESSRQEGVKYLGFDQDKVVSISTAADPQFHPLDLSEDVANEVCSRYRLRRPFVMYTGGIDYRKNIEGLICAYAKLPNALLAKCQLAIVCSIHLETRASLEDLARQQGLKSGDVVLTGFVPEDDLIALYNLCEVFVFPSLHEGFGLPALEAMACGCAVIGSNCSSIPEVIGREDALFDPTNGAAITAKLEQVLNDDNFRRSLALHGLEQAKLFSWDNCGKRAVSALEHWMENRPVEKVGAQHLKSRPKLAYVSPLPPERSGISDYSAELLPALSRHYEIEVVVVQPAVSDAWVKANCRIRDLGWFKKNAVLYDRVLYHFGNSSFHQHMFHLLNEIPGVVVLHDFFLSHLVRHMDWSGQRPGFWRQVLFEGHGYAAALEAISAADKEDVLWKYPCNHSVLQGALGVIVHSANSVRMANQWYGPSAGAGFSVIPLLRAPALDVSRWAARQALKIGEDDFVVCSFGIIGPTKLNHRLLAAWMRSSLGRDQRCHLVFVGENDTGKYGAELMESIRGSGLQSRIQITGWVSQEAFRAYLAAADIGVQLRSLSRGETSAAVLDCLNYSMATIVNANGAMADLPSQCLWLLEDEFDNADLIEALETLWRDDARRINLGKRAQEFIHREHAPGLCADLYGEALERIYQEAETSVPGLIRQLAKADLLPSGAGLAPLADDIAGIGPLWGGLRQILVDVSVLVQVDARTGIQRVVRSLLMELLSNPPIGYRVEPVYARPEHGFRYARRFTLRFLGCPDADLGLADDPIDFGHGDLFLGLDLAPDTTIARSKDFAKMRNRGVHVWFVVYDLLPIIMPEAFPRGTEGLHGEWLRAIAQNGNAICISKAVAEDMSSWIHQQSDNEQMSLCKIRSFHLGADVMASVPSQGMPKPGRGVLKQLHRKQSFLMVGTIEPRKCHAQVLSSFECLWGEGQDINLVIVGKQGWNVDTFATILRNHPLLGERLFWLEEASDEYLEEIYSACSCLIAASEGEGFGLPLIEAAIHNLPIIARDIPVFHEVAGEFAYYFRGPVATNLAVTIKEWLALNSVGNAPQSTNIPWLTWKQSTQQLLEGILPPAE